MHGLSIIDLLIARDMLEQQKQENPSHELIANYTPASNARTNLYSYFPSKLWSETWNTVEQDCFRYISQQTNNFPYNSVINRLKRAIITHSNFQIYPEIRKQMVKIFYRIFNNFIEKWSANKTQIKDFGEIDKHSQQDMDIEPDTSQHNYFQTFAHDYQRIQPRLKKVYSLLTVVLSKHTTAREISKESHQILSKEMINSPKYEQFVRQCIQLIDKYRDSSLSSMEIQSSQILDQIGLLIKTQTFPYVEYLEQSKRYFTQLLARIPTNIEMFKIIQKFVQKEVELSRLIVLDDQKLTKDESWKLSKFEEKESMLGILTKEIIEESYGDMIQYLDYLLMTEEEEKNLVEKKQYYGTKDKKEKIEILKHLWSFTKLLKRYQKGSQNVLLGRFSEIVKDTNKYLKKQQHTHKIVTSKLNFLSLVHQCFQDDPKFINEINNSIEFMLMENQNQLNRILCYIILNPAYRWPGGLSIERDTQQSTNIELNSRYSSFLFKLTPSKENFIRKFEQEFSRYVISTGNSEGLFLQEQEHFIKAMQVECGYMLSKNIEKMLNDVWKNDKQVYYQVGIMRCRVLSPDWPEFIGQDCKLADQLLEIRNQFETQFAQMGDGENQKKTLKWVWQCGTIILNVMGTESILSEIQASIVILLNRSFRPMRVNQFSEILEYPQSQIQHILQQLSSNNLILYSEEGKYYEINLENTTAYNFKIYQKTVTNKQKKSMERDHGIIIEAYITRILKKRKSLQKTDLLRLLGAQLKTYKPNVEELATALEKLCARDIVTIEKARGIIRYIE